MPEAIITIEGIETKASKPGADRAWVRHSVNGGGHYYSWFEGQVEGLDETLLKPGATVKIIYEQKDKYRNITAVEVAAQPIVTPASGNGERYTDSDRGPSFKDEMIARCTAVNGVTAIVAARITADIQTAESELWQEMSQIEHYILTGEKPTMPKSPTLAAVDAQFEAPAKSWPEYVESATLPEPASNPVDRKPPPALLAEVAAYVRQMQAYGIRNVVMPPPGTTEIEVAGFAADLRSRLAELKKNVDLGEEK